MSTPLVGHLDPYFLQIMNETQEMLRTAYRTANRLTFPVSATGMAGMEACVANLIEPGDRMVVCVNGVFGQRMADVAARARADVTVLERPWGEVFDLAHIRDAQGLQVRKVVAERACLRRAAASPRNEVPAIGVRNTRPASAWIGVHDRAPGKA